MLDLLLEFTDLTRSAVVVETCGLALLALGIFELTRVWP